MTVNQRMQLRHDIYFSLNTNQRRKLDSLGYCSVNLNECPMSDFKRVTKSKDLINKLVTLKRSLIRRVA